MPETWSTLVARLAGHRILVVGDTTLDEYLYGKATRLSREAAVPVLELHHRELILGAAANPARNIVALGSNVVQVGVVGADRAGEQLLAALHQHAISTDGIIALPNRPTTTKTRIMAHQAPRLPQHIARLDTIDRTPLSPVDEQRILANLANLVPQVDAVLCSDYQLGLLTPSVVDAVRHLCKQHNILLTVDTQGNAHYYHGVDLFRCNDIEAAAALGSPLRDEQDFQLGLVELRSRLQAHLVVVTRGPHGVSMVGEALEYTHIEAAQVSEVYDTTGAGDTFIALTTLALITNIAPTVAVQMANAAAALVVRKFGNAVVTPEELTHMLKR
jgi:rfaE bifunctional protein kinase chain/domain